MDLQAFIDGFTPMSCVISVQTFPDGNYGNIRIVCGNRAYVDSIENPDNIAYNGMLSNKFIPDSPYERYIPKDLNFEDACFLCAVMKKPFHAYIHPERYNFWVDMYMMPASFDRDDTHYMVYSQELTAYGNAKRMSDIHPSVSADVLETCIKLRGTEDYKKTMDEVISDIRSQCEADKVCLILTDMKRRTFSILSESAGSESADYPVEAYLRGQYDDFFDIIETWNDTIAGSTCLIVKNERDMAVLQERNPVWCNSLREVDVNSIVLYPLIYNNETYGYIWAVNFNVENTERIRATLETSSYFIASEIANRRLLDELRIMGSVDLLTGVKNRNAMNSRVDEIITGGKMLPAGNAVLFADLNGLKQTNDKEGHESGDALLKRAAEMLTGVFPKGEIFRAGGDEFMVLLPEISEDELEERLNEIRSHRFDIEDVSFAIGYCISDGNLDIRKAMSTADKRMYEDKKKYYDELNA